MIAIDYTPAYEQGGGIGRYVRELVKALARQDKEQSYRLFITGAKRDILPPHGANFTCVTSRINPRWWARIWHRAYIPLAVETIVGSIDLYHATDFVLPPTRKTTKTLLTVHDLTFVRVPEAASPKLRAYLNRVVPRSAHRADHILADSEATRQDLIALYALPPAKISVLYSGVDDSFAPVEDPQHIQSVKQTYGIERPYVLSVGTVQPRKNYPRLIQALALLRSSGIDIDLVISGGKGWLDDPIYRTIGDHKLTDHVHLIGYAADEHLPSLYSGAACFALPSLYEGFGLPVLEAMACGTPVLTSDISSLPEIAGDAALTVTPTDVDAIAHQLEKLVNDSSLRQDLVRRGLERAKTFSWDSSARQLQATYRQLLAS